MNLIIEFLIVLVIFVASLSVDTLLFLFSSEVKTKKSPLQTEQKECEKFNKEMEEINFLYPVKINPAGEKPHSDSQSKRIG